MAINYELLMLSYWMSVQPTLTKTFPPVPVEGLPENPFATIVVVVLSTGLKKETCGK